MRFNIYLNIVLIDIYLYNTLIFIALIFILDILKYIKLHFKSTLISRMMNTRKCTLRFHFFVKHCYPDMYQTNVYKDAINISSISIEINAKTIFFVWIYNKRTLNTKYCTPTCFVCVYRTMFVSIYTYLLPLFKVNDAYLI